MRTRSYRAPKCPFCHRLMRKNGLNRNTTQRWQCPECSLNSTHHRNLETQRIHDLRHIFPVFLDWLLSRIDQNHASGKSARQFRRDIEECWNIHTHIPVTGEVHHAVEIDGTYLAHGWCLLLATDAITGKIIAKQYCDYEKTASYEALLKKLPTPDIVITDGLKGIPKAVERQWVGARIQRCLVHVRRDTITDLTRHPKTEAGQELLELVNTLLKVENSDQARQWLTNLNSYYQKFTEFINHKTLKIDDPTNPKAKTHKAWWWTHETVRRSYRRLMTLNQKGQLFAFLDPEIISSGAVPHSTNKHEGGTNSPLKKLVHAHGALSETHMLTLVSWYCSSKSEFFQPETDLEKYIQKLKSKSTHL